MRNLEQQSIDNSWNKNKTNEGKDIGLQLEK